MPYPGGTLRLRVLKARALFDTMSSPPPLQSCSSTAGMQFGSLVPVAPEFLFGVLSEGHLSLRKESIGQGIPPRISPWSWKSGLCLASCPESCKLRFFARCEHKPLGRVPVRQCAWLGEFKGFPASRVRGLQPTGERRAVHSVVRRLSREGYSSELSDAADSDVESKLRGRTVELKVGALDELSGASPEVADIGETEKALVLEDATDAPFLRKSQISVPENVAVNVVDEYGRVVEGWGTKAMGLLRGLLGVGETCTSSLIGDTDSLRVLSAVNKQVPRVSQPSKISASSDTVPVRPWTVGDLQHAIVDQGVAGLSFSRSSTAQVAAVLGSRSEMEGDAQKLGHPFLHMPTGAEEGETAVTQMSGSRLDTGIDAKGPYVVTSRLDTSANVRDTSLMVPTFANQESADLALDSVGFMSVTVDQRVSKSSMISVSGVDADAEEIDILKTLVAELEVGAEKEYARRSTDFVSHPGVGEDDEKIRGAGHLVSLTVLGDDRKMNVAILPEGSANEVHISEPGPVGLFEGAASDAVPSPSRTLEKVRTPADRRKRNTGSVNKQPTMLHDLLTVPGIGPRNMEKFIAKGILKVAELKQLYKEKFRDQQSEKMVEFLKHSIGIVHKNHAMSIASYIKETVDGESENEDTAADGNSRLPPRRRLTFCVEGNISVGKTTFLQKIANETLELRDLVEVVPEPVGKWQDIGPDHFNILNAFYEEPQRYAYTFQNYVFVTRLMQERESAVGLKPLRLMERSVFSDRMVFVRAVHEAKWMSEMEISIYDSWFDPVVSVLPGLVPDAFIYMRASPDTCHRRLQMRKRPEEQTVTLDYLRDLHDKHEQWLFPAGKGDGHNILVSEWPLGLHEGVPSRIKDRVFYLQGENVHSCIQKVPALVLDCEATIDFSRDIEAKAEYAKQVAEFFDYVRRMKESEGRARNADNTNPTRPLVLPRSSLLGPDGSVLRANAIQALDFGGQELSSFCS